MEGERLIGGVLHLIQIILSASVLHLMLKAQLRDEYKLLIFISVLYVLTLEIRARTDSP